MYILILAYSAHCADIVNIWATATAMNIAKKRGRIAGCMLGVYASQRCTLASFLNSFLLLTHHCETAPISYWFVYDICQSNCNYTANMWQNITNVHWQVIKYYTICVMNNYVHRCYILYTCIAILHTKHAPMILHRISVEIAVHGTRVMSIKVFKKS